MISLSDIDVKFIDPHRVQKQYTIYTDECCPNCGWEPDGSDYDDPQKFLGMVEDIANTDPNVYSSFYTPSDWIALWKCPYCCTMFETEGCNY